MGKHHITPTTHLDDCSHMNKKVHHPPALPHLIVNCSADDMPHRFRHSPAQESDWRRT